jgi:hypothetical protein
MPSSVSFEPFALLFLIDNMLPTLNEAKVVSDVLNETLSDTLSFDPVVQSDLKERHDAYCSLFSELTYSDVNSIFLSFSVVLNALNT